jgi:hypothetical protein
MRPSPESKMNVKSAAAGAGGTDIGETSRDFRANLMLVQPSLKCWRRRLKRMSTR